MDFKPLLRLFAMPKLSCKTSLFASACVKERILSVTHLSSRPTASKEVWPAGLVIALVFIPAILAAFKYGQTGLNADIVINQIMARQHITMFYWGQNRILNIIPFLLAPISGAYLDIFFLLFIATASFFGSLYLLAIFCWRILSKSENPAPSRLIYLLLICAAIFTFRRPAWESLCLWHFEYSLPLLLTLINLYLYYFKNKWPGILSLSLAFLAIGLNPAICIFVLPGLALCVFLYPRLWIKSACLLGWYGACLIAWVIVSSFYGSYDDYSSLVFVNFQSGLTEIFANLIKEYLKPGALLIAFCLALTLYLVCARCRPGWLTPLSPPDRSLIASGLLLCLLFTAIIVCIRWVQMNEFSPRYLAFNIYLSLFLAAYLLVRVYQKIFTRLAKLSIVCPLLLACVIYFLYPPSFNLAQSTIYKKCDQLLAPGERFYAGDYWLIWACASRDLNQGFTSQVLGYRSVSNAANIKAAIASKSARSSCIDVECLHEKTEICVKQIRDHLPQAEIIAIREKAEDSRTIRIRTDGQSD